MPMPRPQAIGPLLFAILTAPLAAADPKPRIQADPPKKCDACEAWNAPHEPFRVFGNTYYVGVAGLSAVLIASDDGLILLDGGLSQSAPLIDANIAKLGSAPRTSGSSSTLTRTTTTPAASPRCSVRAAPR